MIHQNTYQFNHIKYTMEQNQSNIQDGIILPPISPLSPISDSSGSSPNHLSSLSNNQPHYSPRPPLIDPPQTPPLPIYMEEINQAVHITPRATELPIRPIAVRPLNYKPSITKNIINGAYEDDYFRIMIAKPTITNGLSPYPVLIHNGRIQFEMKPCQEYVISIEVSPKYKPNWEKDIWFTIEGTYGDEPIILSDRMIYCKTYHILSGTVNGQCSGFQYYINTEIEDSHNLKGQVQDIKLNLKLYQRVPKQTITSNLEEGEIDESVPEIDGDTNTKKQFNISQNDINDDNYTGTYVNPLLGNISNSDFNLLDSQEYQLKLTHKPIDDNIHIKNNYQYTKSIYNYKLSTINQQNQEILNLQEKIKAAGEIISKFSSNLDKDRERLNVLVLGSV